MEKAVAEVTEAGCNALTVFLGNFGPETPETLIAKFFNGPCMFVAAAEGDGDMINGRGDAYCGMLNCSYNLGMRHLKGYIPEYPIGTADEIADKMIEFVPIARTLLGVRDLKIITFGPRPQDFSQKINAKVKNLALRRAFFDRAVAGEIEVIERFEAAAAKTKAINSVVGRIAPEGKILIVDAPFGTEVRRAARNIKRVTLQDATQLNTLDLTQYRKVLLSEKAIENVIARMKGGN